jgi:ribonuclease HII
MVILVVLPLIDMNKYEEELYSKGINYIGGIDEAGRGPLCGPVVAACVILPKDYKLEGLTDSKKLSKKKRELFYSIIMEQAIDVGIGIIDSKIIDEVNILEATKLAMKESINNLKIIVDHLLIDAVRLDIDIHSTSIIKGDSKSISIAAASVIAKVTRDRIMDELDQKYPQYAFKNHKGYPTKKHIEAIKKYGVLEEHRKCFKPVSDNL